MARPVVVDTNVVVGGLITSTPNSPLAQIVDGMLAGRFPFLLSPSLLREYRAVVLRPKVRKLHALEEEMIEELLVSITINAIWREPSETHRAEEAPDPNDGHLWLLLNTMDDATLVTGDRLLLEQPPKTHGAVSPRAFIELQG